MKVLFDLNVILDVALDRTPWVADSKGGLQLVLDGRVEGYLAAISVTTLFYIARRSGGLDKAFAGVDLCLATFRIAPVGELTLATARSLKGNDFEDNVQIALAIEAGVDAIVTRNATHFQQSTVAVLTPAELVERIPAR